ncbi:unnamed protein product [Sphenostylis stenocarpa]|uniref:Uncharacterized protein n=1 Tax=Sphenostylis stenocarpa TaxID=92480 RepID=A0AA86SXE7_9FABA|nr:unnamed protein product [Sphenostylis stenocarpa]
MKVVRPTLSVVSACITHGTAGPPIGHSQRSQRRERGRVFVDDEANDFEHMRRQRSSTKGKAICNMITLKSNLKYSVGQKMEILLSPNSKVLKKIAKTARISGRVKNP